MASTALTPIPSGTNFNFTPGALGNYLLSARSVTYGPSYGTFGPQVQVAVTEAPTLAYSIVNTNLVLTWSDPTYSLQQASTLSPPSWVTLSSNSPALFPLNSGPQRFFRLHQ